TTNRPRTARGPSPPGSRRAVSCRGRAEARPRPPAPGWPLARSRRRSFTAPNEAGARGRAHTLAAVLERFRFHIDPYANDPSRWAHSMVNLGEILIPCLDAAGARSVVEIGAYAGNLTGLLVDWAAERGARVWAIDPSPEEELVRLGAERDELELVRETSLAALPRLPDFDALIVDGDHNYHTVTEELRLVADRAQGA